MLLAMHSTTMKRAVIPLCLMVAAQAAANDGEGWQWYVEGHLFHYRIDAAFARSPGDDYYPATLPSENAGELPVAPRAESPSQQPGSQAPAHSQPRPPQPAPMREYRYSGDYLLLSAQRGLLNEPDRRRYLQLSLDAMDYRNRNAYDEQRGRLALYHEQWRKDRGWQLGLGFVHDQRGGEVYHNTLDISAYAYRSFTKTSRSSLSLALEYADYHLSVADPHDRLDGLDSELTLSHKWLTSWPGGPPGYWLVEGSGGMADKGRGVYDSRRIGWGLAYEKPFANGGELTISASQQWTRYPARDGRPLGNQLAEEDERSIVVEYSHPLGKHLTLRLSGEYTEIETNRGALDSRQSGLFLGLAWRR